MRITCALRVVSLSFVMVLPAFAQITGEHWVATWATAAQIYRTPLPLAPAAPAVASTAPAPAPVAAATPARPRPPQSFNNQTVRMIVHTSIGGKRLRIQLTNPFGSATVEIGSAHIALRDKESFIVPASGTLFHGHGKLGIPGGGDTAWSPSGQQSGGCHAGTAETG